MNKLEVGKLFKEGVTRYQEGCRVDLNDTGFNFCIYFNRPTDDEIYDITKGDFKFGYYLEKNVLLLLFKFGTMEWMDSPYSVHLSKNLSKIPCIDNSNSGLALNIYFIDASNGILKGMRLIGLKNKTSKMLLDDIRKQKEMPYKDFSMNLNEIYRKYPTKALVSMAKGLY